MSVRQVGRLGLRLAAQGVAAYLLATAATCWWYEARYLPRIAADFDPGPGLWLEKRA